MSPPESTLSPLRDASRFHVFFSIRQMHTCLNSDILQAIFSGRRSINGGHTAIAINK
jgi:hypothetical protein